jgi:hypothetical protein
MVRYKKSTIIHGTVEKAEDKATHYVDRHKFYSALVERKQQLANNENPRVSEYIGECLLKIAIGLSRKWNFRDYTYKDEMISDAVVHCLRYIDKFDPKVSTNPFSYYTQAMYYLFVNRLKSEQVEQYVKYKATLESASYNEVATQPDAHTEYDIDMSDLDFGDIEKFVHDFERKERNAAKAPKKPKKKNALSLDDFSVELIDQLIKENDDQAIQPIH